MKTQEQWVVEQLKRNGQVSRNGALSNFISRLGSIINRLNNEGWDIKGDYEKTEKGKDYIYRLISKPKEKKVEIINGIAFIVYK